MRKTRSQLLKIVLKQLSVYEQMSGLPAENDFEKGYHVGSVNALKSVLLYAEEKTPNELWPNLK